MKIAYWMTVILTPTILLIDLILKLMGNPTISENIFQAGATAWEPLLHGGLGFLFCHLLLGKSGNG